MDDPAPCTIQDNVAPDATCTSTVDPSEFLFKMEYTTANGTLPQGRYGYFESVGANNSQAETECQYVLQHVFNTSQAYLNFELAEIQLYRGNICGQGFRLKDKLGEIKVKRVRKAGAHVYDYDLELTCTDR